MGDLDRKIEVSFELTGEETVEEAIKKINDYVKSTNIELDRARKRRTEEEELARIEERRRKLEEKAFRDAAKGYRQSHGAQVKLNKEAQKTADLFSSLYRAPAKVKPYKSFGVTKDIVDAMTPKYLGTEMIDAAAKIRKSTMQEVASRQKNAEWLNKLTFGYKEYRKFLTGVLIDLHWLRILGANSKIVSANIQMLGDAIGYVIDMILLPMLPAMIELTMWIIRFGDWIASLPKPFRNLITVIGAFITGSIAIATVLAYATSAILAFTTALNTATAAVSGKAAAETAGVLGAGAGGGMLARFGALAIPVILATIVAWIGQGVLNAYADWVKSNKPMYEGGGKGAISTAGSWTGASGFEGSRKPIIDQILTGEPVKLFQEGGVVTKPTLGIFGEAGPEAIIPLNEIGNIMGQIFGAGAGITDTLSKAIQGSAGGFVGGLTTGGKGGATEVFAKGISWLLLAIDTGFKATNELLAGILGLIPNIGKIILGGAANIGELFLKWLTDSLGKAGELGKKLLDAVIKWIVDGLGKTYNIAKELFDKVVKWIADGLKKAYDIAKELFDKVVEWLKKGLETVYDIAKTVYDTVTEWIKNGFATIFDFATKVFLIVVDWIKSGFVSILDFATNVFWIVVNWIKNGFVTILDFATKLYEIIVDWFGKGLATILDFATKLFIMITGWVSEGLKTPVELAVALFNTVKQWVKDSLPALPDLATAIKDLIIEFARGILKGTPGVGTAITIGEIITGQQGKTEKKLTKTIPAHNERGGIDGYWYYYSDGTREYVKSGSSSFGGGETGGRTESTGSTSTGETGGEPTGTGNIITAANTFIGEVGETLKSGADTIVNGVTNTAKTFSDTVVNTVTNVANTVKDIGNTVITAASNVVNTAVTTASNVITTAATAVSGVIGGLFSGIPKLQEGGYVMSEGLAFLHRGETVVPAQVSKGAASTPQIVINNPTFQISGRTDRELFENFLRMLKTEGARMV